jgi:hypothetical protein
MRLLLLPLLLSPLLLLLQLPGLRHAKDPA